MKPYLPLAILATAALATGCARQSDSGSAAGTNDTRIELKTLTGSYTYRLTGSAADFMRDSDITCFDSAAVVMPEHIGGRDIKPLRDSILRLAFDTIASPADAMQAYFKREAAKSGYTPAAVPASASAEAAAEGLLLIDGSVISLTPGWLTYCVTTAVSEPGAAHGLTTKRYLNYSIIDGNLVTLSTLFTPAGLAALPELIAKQAQRMRPVLGDTSIDALPADGNFLVASDGTIIFAYQPYEVASYAQGEIRVPFYPYQLSDLLTPAGLRLFHLDGTL
ncbi:MAG: RsiV family protein [Bacteroides sp.]|nr:RsiV family protein [Bacteroides sp.]MCM1095377.1 RsiV family protein [Terasakiella sp.]